MLPAANADAQSCCGDCDGNRRVAINEVIMAVTEVITAVTNALDGCQGNECCGDCDVVAINELVTGVGSALDGCPVIWSASHGGRRGAGTPVRVDRGALRSTFMTVRRNMLLACTAFLMGCVSTCWAPAERKTS